MKFSNLDFLSPQITFFFFGKCRHSSPLGGVMTLLMIILWIYYIIHILVASISNNSLSVNFHREYSKSAIKYSFSSSEIFHYFEFYNRKVNNSNYYNPKYIRIYMISFFSEYEPILLEQNDHWLYDNCIEEDIPLNSEEYINKLVNFTKGACLRYYYNSKLKKYFSVNDTNNFISPFLISDNSKINYYNLMTIIEKCSENSISSKILGECADENEIENYLKIHNFSLLHILNHEIDTYNYSNPKNSYIQDIFNSLNTNNTIINNINFSPLNIKTQNGFLSNSTYENTYILEGNIIPIIHEAKNKYILGIYYYWLQNNVQIFERRYKNFYFDILPSIGAVIQLIYNIFFLLNLIFNKVNIVNDSQNLIFQCNRNMEEARLEQIKFSSMVKSLQLNNSRFSASIQNIIKPSEIVAMRHKSIMEYNEESLKKIHLKNNLIGRKSNLELNKLTFKKYPSYNADNNRFPNLDEYDKTKDQLLSELNCMQINNINRNNKRKSYKKYMSEIRTFKNNYIDEVKKKPLLYSDLINKKRISNLENDTYLLGINKSKSNENNNGIKRLSLKKQNKKSTFYPHNYNAEKEKIKLDVINLSKMSDRKQKIINRNRRITKSDTSIGKSPLSNQKRKYSTKRKKEKIKKINAIKSKYKTAYEQNFNDSIHQIEHRNKTGIDSLLSVSKIRLSNHQFTFCDYLKSFFENKDKKNAIYIFEQFRKKLLSEEHNFRTSMFLCFSEKIFVEHKRKIDLIELYDNL